MKKEIEGLKSKFERISSAFKSYESSHGGHKPHPDTEKSREFVGAEYDDLKGLNEEAKKDLMTLGERLNSLGAQVDEMASEIDSLVQHRYSFNVILIKGPELVEAGSKDRGTQRQFSENICSEDDMRSRIFGTFVVKFLACLALLGFSNI